MKIILKEYLASLKERGDLDKSVLPNLLSEIGLRVLNTPMIGTRQNGVDIAAVGKIKGEDDQKYLYLFCIKAGNVTRRDWELSVQAVRPELNEIRDVYIRSNIAKEYADLPIKICLCCGGELEETVLVNWAGYTDEHTTEKITYEEWNGDRLAELMMRSLLARELLVEDAQRNFQKAVAMVNEPNACYEYTRNFLESLLLEKQSDRKIQLLRLRQSYICLHAVTAWAIEAKNLESTYKVSELGMLFCWNAMKDIKHKNRPSKHDIALRTILDQFIKLYLMTSEMYFEKTAFAHGETLHALSVAVKSNESVDVNLMMFELVGRLAIRGVWTDFISKSLSSASPAFSDTMKESTYRTIDSIISVINNNPILATPLKDDHMIEISLIMYLAQITNSTDRFLPWLEAISGQTTFALITNTQYPTSLTDYNDLLSHPLSDKQSCRDDACTGSILYPYIYFWMQQATNEEQINEFLDRLNKNLPNCTYQTWFPDEETDELIWSGNTYHGICVTDVSPLKGYDSLEESLNKAMEMCTEIENISAIKFGLTPLFLTACRHYRLPISPNFWYIPTS